MLFFWAYIEESDIETFVGTLYLPPYMAHLRLEPFSLAEQQFNSDGLHPLLLKYSGQGRFEELRLSPKKYALRLLRHVFPSIRPDSVRIPGNSEPIWNWEKLPCEGGEFRHRLRLFFEWNETPSAPSKPPFSPWQTFLSVTRKEVFIGEEVLRQYFASWIAGLGASAYSEQPLRMVVTGSGYSFENKWVGGELSLENDSILDDILDFADLHKAILELAGEVTIDTESPEIIIEKSGLTLPLAIKTREKSRIR